MRYKLPRPAIKAYEVEFLHAGRGIPCRLAAATQLVIIIIIIIKQYNYTHARMTTYPRSTRCFSPDRIPGVSMIEILSSTVLWSCEH